MQRIKIILVDDHKIVSSSLTPLLNEQPDMQVLASVNDGRKAVTLALKLRPDIIIMDIGISGLNGIDATRQIVSQAPEIRVIILSMHTDRRYVTGALDAGASGYLTKSCSFEELADAVRLVHDDKKYLSPEISGIVIQESLGRSAPLKPSRSPRLSMREREVLQLLAEGRSVKQIAAQLFLSIKTVHTHRSQIMKKLEISNIAGLTKYAIREGMTSLKD